MKQIIRPLTVCIVNLALLIALDTLWLGFIMKDFYTTQLHKINQCALTEQTVYNMPAALGAWTLIILGLLLFVLPATAQASYHTTFLWGACFGFTIYGIYNLTNIAIIKELSMQLALCDLLWGTVVTALLASSLKWCNGKL